jgi:hypothetical protein
VACGDLDGDGRLDVIATNTGSANLSVLRNLGNATFAPQVQFTTGFGPEEVVAANVDGVGGDDLIVANGGASFLSILDNCAVLPVPGDATGDGIVDVEDLLAVLAAWGPCNGCPADVNDDGVVDVGDILIVLANWS